METTKARFGETDSTPTAPLPRVGITLTVIPTADGIQVNYFPTVNKESRARIFVIRAENGESFIVPADLHQSTVNMLIGIGQRFVQLQRWGFDREP